MWTPKRVLILVSGLLLFLSGYGVYAFFLGDIDGLQPLDAGYYPPENQPPDELVPQESLREAMIKQAFGPGCEELGSSRSVLARWSHVR